MSMRHHSFALSRPGLKPGYTIPGRLRFVDTLTRLFAIMEIFAIVAIAFVVDELLAHVNRPAFAQGMLVRISSIVFVAVGTVWFIHLISIILLRQLFLVIGLLTPVEAKMFPLEAFAQKDVHPWPESWQQPDASSSEALPIEDSLE